MKLLQVPSMQHREDAIKLTMQKYIEVYSWIQIFIRQPVHSNTRQFTTDQGFQLPNFLETNLVIDLSFCWLMIFFVCSHCLLIQFRLMPAAITKRFCA